MPIQLIIPVSNVTPLISLGYTTLEVWVTTDSGNTYNEVTAPTATSAVLTSLPALTTFDMNGGKLLKLQVNGGPEKDIFFDGSIVRYWTPAQVATQINSVVSIATVVGNSVVLTSSTTGRASTLYIIYNDTSLGWDSGTLDNGNDSRITLSGSNIIYTYTDLAGSPSYSYKWRFSASGANPISNFSPTVNGTLPASTGPISIATATFVGVNGVGIPTTVMVTTETSPQLVNSFYVSNSIPSVYTSDSTGFIQIPMLQGITVRVGIDGTPFVREFIVPNTASFDLISAMAAAQDPFTVQVPTPLLTRRTL